jgi:hypothetical protein
MDADSIHRLTKLGNFLETILNDYLERSLPLRRIVFLSSILKLTSRECDFLIKLYEKIISEQKDDGGWIDCEDTAWSVFTLLDSKQYSKHIRKAIIWLGKEQIHGGVWGFCKRDYPNIPITSQILLTIPELRSKVAVSWLEKEWSKDLDSTTNLNYKGAWYLLVYSRLFKNFSLSATVFNKTVDYLINEQREDGGWGPWRKHPAPTDAFITGISAAALANAFVINKNLQTEEALNKSIKWFLNNQLENGLFPTHYIEEGSAWCYFGWKEAINCLE